MFKLSYILLLTLVLVSCREDFTFHSTEVNEELNFISEINPEEPVTVDLFKTISLTGNNSEIDLTMAEIDFGGSDFPSKSTKVIYRAVDDNFILRNTDFRPSPGNSYWMRAWIPNSDLDTISAQTFIPEPIGLRSAEIISLEKYRISDTKENVKVEIEIELETPKQRPGYFQILPSRKVSTFRMDENGNPIVSNTSDVLPLNVDQIQTARNAVFEFNHKDGVFVDYSRLNGQKIILTLLTDDPIDNSREILSLLDIKINTLSEELYNYHLNLSTQLINSQSDFFTPADHYTNVENGFGVMGSFSSKSSTIEVQ